MDIDKRHPGGSGGGYWVRDTNVMVVMDIDKWRPGGGGGGNWPGTPGSRRYEYRQRHLGGGSGGN